MQKPILVTLLDNLTSVGASDTTPAGLHYVYIFKDQDAMGAVAVSLPFLTDSHLLGIPKGKEALLNISAHLSELEPVVLEGDYGDYFTLYTAPNQQVETRELLDPAAMEFSVDFCSAFIWEIVNDTLYFASKGLLPDFKVVDTFVQQITPAVAIDSRLHVTERPQTNEELEVEVSSLECPVCHIGLRAGRNWLSCSNGHGYLLTATELITTRRHMDDPLRIVSGGGGSGGALTGSTPSAASYGGPGLVIITCY